MTIKREDILRELELLPVWKLNPSFATKQQAPTLTDAPATEVLAVHKQSAEGIENIALPEIAVPVTQVELEAAPMETKSEPKLAVAWLLYCPLDIAADQDELTLLTNMVRAMQLLSTDYLLVHDAGTLTGYQPSYALLFGLDAAQTYLGKAVSCTDTKEQPYMHAQSPCWVVHHPKQLIENPSLKREAWHIMCAAKAHAQKANMERLQQT